MISRRFFDIRANFEVYCSLRFALISRNILNMNWYQYDKSFFISRKNLILHSLKKILVDWTNLGKLNFSISTWTLKFQCLDFRKAFFRRNSVCSGTRAGCSSRVKQHTPITQPDHCSEIACACAPHDGLVFVYPLAQVHVVFCTNFQKTVNFQEG